jgi:hypothetical protein
MPKLSSKQKQFHASFKNDRLFKSNESLKLKTMACNHYPQVAGVVKCSKDEHILLFIFLLYINFSVAGVGNKRKHSNQVVPSTSQKKVFIKYKLY